MVAVHYPVDNIPVHCGWVSGLEHERMEQHLKTFHGWEPDGDGEPTRAGMDLAHRNLHAGGTLPGAEDEPDADWFDAEGYSTPEPEIPADTAPGGVIPSWVGVGPAGFRVKHTPTTTYDIQKRVVLGSLLPSLERIEMQAEEAIKVLLGSEPRPSVHVDVEWDADAEPPVYVMLIHITLSRPVSVPAATYAVNVDMPGTLSVENCTLLP